jgi:hypothetical protein
MFPLEQERIGGGLRLSPPIDDPAPQPGKLRLVDPQRHNATLADFREVLLGTATVVTTFSGNP